MASGCMKYDVIEMLIKNGKNPNAAKNRTNSHNFNFTTCI